MPLFLNFGPPGIWIFVDPFIPNSSSAISLGCLCRCIPMPMEIFFFRKQWNLIGWIPLHNILETTYLFRVPQAQFGYSRADLNLDPKLLELQNAGFSCEP